MSQPLSQPGSAAGASAAPAAVEPPINTDVLAVRQELLSPRKSSFRKYQELVIGAPGLRRLIEYEAITLLCGRLGGAAGLFLRSKLYPRLLGRVGRGVVFGSNVVLRHPHKIFIGNDVVIDDNVVLDAKGRGNRGIVIGDGVFIGRNSILNCKNGNITLGNGSLVGFNCILQAGREIRVGDNVLIAAFSYLVGGRHGFEQTDVPIRLQQVTSRGIEIGDNTWLGGRVTVMDGTRIGRECVIGAGAVVNKDIADWRVAVGLPAREVKDRRSLETRIPAARMEEA
jgi:acetyltransferase-like isoleucine patch superfamily enzyme